MKAAIYLGSVFMNFSLPPFSTILYQGSLGMETYFWQHSPSDNKKCTKNVPIPGYLFAWINIIGARVGGGGGEEQRGLNIPPPMPNLVLASSFWTFNSLVEGNCKLWISSLREQN